VPVVDDPVPLRDAVRSARHGSRLLLLLSEQERLTTLRMAMEQAASTETTQEPAEEVRPEFAIAVAVGPEGGWTAREEALLAAEGWQPVSLGPRILRAETAAITAIAVVAAWLE
jgi:16S rRNA (uracil1498-N3)-methyltransferase